MYRLTSLQVGDQRWWAALVAKALAFSRQTIKKASGAAGPRLPIWALPQLRAFPQVNTAQCWVLAIGQTVVYLR